VRDLRHYLEFAERGPAALGAVLQSVGGLDSFESYFEEAVAEGLRRRGWDLHSQIGVSKFRIDLGVIHPDWPGTYLVGLECDGATYHSSPSARDRDRVRQAILESHDWRLLRIWSTDFFIDGRGTIERLDGALQKLLEEDRARAASAAESAPAGGVTVETEPVAEEAADGVEDFVEEKSEEETVEAAPEDLMDDVVRPAVEPEDRLARVARQGGGSPPAVGEGAWEAPPELDPEHFHDSGYDQVIRRLGLGIIDAEGPVTFDHLATRIARAHGFKRTGGQIRRTVEQALARQRPESRGPDQKKIYWPAEALPRQVISYRGLNGGGAERAWTDVPDPERLGLAIRVLSESPVNDPEDEPAAAMAALIGITRLRQTTREELEQLLQRAREMKPEDGGEGGGAGGES
jgi:very-short-patch-repair endonuclease